MFERISRHGSIFLAREGARTCDKKLLAFSSPGVNILCQYFFSTGQMSAPPFSGSRKRKIIMTWA